MKGIGLILFSISMFALSILSAMMLNYSDWYLWIVTLLISLIAGIVAAVIGLILVCRRERHPQTREDEANK